MNVSKSVFTVSVQNHWGVSCGCMVNTGSVPLFFTCFSEVVNDGVGVQNLPVLYFCDLISVSTLCFFLTSISVCFDLGRYSKNPRNL